MSKIAYYVTLIIKEYKISSPPPKEPMNPKLPTIGSSDLKNFELKFSKYIFTIFLLSWKEINPLKKIYTKLKIVIQGLGKFIIR